MDAAAKIRELNLRLDQLARGSRGNISPDSFVTLLEAGRYALDIRSASNPAEVYVNNANSGTFTPVLASDGTTLDSGPTLTAPIGEMGIVLVFYTYQQTVTQLKNRPIGEFNVFPSTGGSFNAAGEVIDPVPPPISNIFYPSVEYSSGLPPAHNLLHTGTNGGLVPPPDTDSITVGLGNLNWFVFDDPLAPGGEVTLVTYYGMTSSTGAATREAVKFSQREVVVISL